MNKHEEFLKSILQGMLSNPITMKRIENLSEDADVQLELLYQESVTVADFFMERMSMDNTDRIEEKQKIRSMRDIRG